MKITRRQIRIILREAMENHSFEFSIDPEEYISKDLNVEEMNTMISLILDSHGINYFTERESTSMSDYYLYEFGHKFDADGERLAPDEESYQAFLALRDALQNVGLPMRSGQEVALGYKKPYFTAGDANDYPEDDMTYIIISQRKRK